MWTRNLDPLYPLYYLYTYYPYLYRTIPSYPYTTTGKGIRRVGMVQ